jgi:hypothetical protein
MPSDSAVVIAGQGLVRLGKLGLGMSDTPNPSCGRNLSPEYLAAVAMGARMRFVAVIIVGIVLIAAACRMVWDSIPTMFYRPKPIAVAPFGVNGSALYVLFDNGHIWVRTPDRSSALQEGSWKKIYPTKAISLFGPEEPPGF